jgi:hypothetical protein
MLMPMTSVVGRLMIVLMTVAIGLTACGGSKKAERCGLTLDGQMLRSGDLMQLDYSMRTRTVNGLARVETWRIVGSDDATDVYRTALTPLGPPSSASRSTRPRPIPLNWQAGEHVYAEGCQNGAHRLQARKLTVG